MPRPPSAGPDADRAAVAVAGPAGMIRWPVYLAIALVAVVTYLYGLDGRYIPKNGDENVYLHILRLTAHSGQLLPLQSDLDGMRNTKPPLLTWQGIAASDWGRQWELERLRLPSVGYTVATALMVLLLGWKLSGRQWRTGLIGMTAFLVFFSTFRYGRAFLTNPPEVFWLFVPFFALLMGGPAMFASRLWTPLALALAIGIGMLYKSFALLLPVGVGLAWWYLHHRSYALARFLVEDASKLALVAMLSLGIFALWFVFDPDPQSVWQEFVVGENAEKFSSDGGYLRTLLWGGFSIWSLAANYPLNAGLLMFPVAVLFVHAVAGRRELTVPQQLLWIWVITLFLVFSLPSQRSGRYLMPAMPALAVLLSLQWERIGRGWFALTLGLCALVIGLFGWLGWKLDLAMAPQSLYPSGHWLLLALAALVIVTGLLRARWTRPASLLASLLVYLCFGATVMPLDGVLGQYSEPVRRQMVGRDVYVPCNFRAMYEGHRFLLPGANVLGYDDDDAPSAATLAARFHLFAVRTPLDGRPCDGDCRVIGERLEIRGRHSSAQIDQMLAGRVFENLFQREWLVESLQVPAPAVPADGKTSGCR